MQQEKRKQAWGSRLGLILAMAGSAVGVGNFIRFPVQAIQNGGGSFIIPYLVSFVLLGIPLSIIEWTSGKYGGLAGYHSTPMITQVLSKGKIWKYVGSMGTFSSFIISAYYCYIESWAMAYFFHSLLSSFTGMTSAQVSNLFVVYLDMNQSTLGIPFENVFFYLVCAIINAYILSRGIQNGIEKVSKFMMPLLFLLAVILAVRAYTMKAGVDGAVYDGLVGFDFLWYPEFDSLSNPKVWLAAAGQIFFTCSLGMGALQCYASFLRSKDDVALNSVTACFTNEFAEIVLGSAIIVPIAIGYFGIDQVVAMTQSGGFGLGFRSLPYLFAQWGPFWSVVAGSAFFGLLFFASITSILSISTPSIEFMVDGFSVARRKAAIIYCVMLTIVGLPTVIWFNYGVFDEYDFWGGTVALFVYGMIECILFAWVMGMDKGWTMINAHANIKLPIALKYVMKYVTPTMLIIIFVSACIKPVNDDWSKLSLKGWELDNSSVISMLTHKGIGPNDKWTADHFYCENEGEVTAVSTTNGVTTMTVGGKNYELPADCKPAAKVGDNLKVGDVLYDGDVVNLVCYSDLTRLGLVFIFLFNCLLVRYTVRHPKNLV
ncbi:MAG: sodium-dependent transporter [Paludibacteraceae bacterium]|nr:sodium-dependent transporter [Paludibacteraceae bacterium]